MNSNLANLVNLMSEETSVHDSYVSTITSVLSKQFDTAGLEAYIDPLPEHVLQLIVSAITAYDISKYKSYKEVIEQLQHYGILEFNPIICKNSNAAPVLVLNAGKYLMPVDTTFALVSNIEDMTIIRKADCDFGFLTNDLEYLSDTGLYQTLLVAIAYQLVATDENLRSMKLNGLALLHSFVSKCITYLGVPRMKPGLINSLRLNVCESIDAFDDICPEDEFARIGIKVPNDEDLVQLRVGYYYILAITKNKVARITLPEIECVGIECLQDNHYLQILSLYVLNVAGCYIGWNTEFTNGEDNTVFTIGELNL